MQGFFFSLQLITIMHHKKNIQEVISMKLLIV